MDFRNLPVELNMMILDFLDLENQKNMRLVCTKLELVANKQLFRRVYFDLDPGGCAALTKISRHSSLRHEVREVTLRRRSFVPTFPNFDIFARAIADEDRARWETLGKSGQRTLFAEYQLYVCQLDRSAARLASALGRMATCRLTRISREPPSDGEHRLDKFSTAIASCPGLMSLSHLPSFDSHLHRWVWQGWNFSACPPTRVRCWFDADAEALQMLTVLNLFARREPPLHRVSIVSDGPAFWSDRHIRILLKTWAYKGASRPVDGALHTLIHPELPNNNSESKRMEAQKALEILSPDLSYLSELRLDVRSTDQSRGSRPSWNTMSRLLLEAPQAQNLQLRYGYGQITKTYQPNFDLKSSSLSIFEVSVDEQWLMIILRNNSSLEYLDIQNSTLAQGAWKTVFCWMQQKLRLRSLRLFNLGYTRERSSYRRLFIPMQHIQGMDLCAAFLQNLVIQESESKFGQTSETFSEALPYAPLHGWPST